MTRVVDASAVVAALIDSGPDGEWSASILKGSDLAAPYLMRIEAANVLRRAALSGEVSVDAATQAYADLLDLRVVQYPLEPLGARVWELRNVVTAYDAWYVALAEALGTELVTLDLRLSRVSGIGCGFLTPATPS